MTTNIAINGLGRIGRCVLRAYFENTYPELNLTAINLSTHIDDFINLIKYDSIHGRFNADIEVKGDKLIINKHPIKIFSSKEAEKTPWEQAKVDIILECTGTSKTRKDAEKHLKNNVKKILISAPMPDADSTIVFGVNHLSIKKTHQIISVGSCTTNALAPIAKILNDNFNIESGYMTTIHSYTNDQNIVDNRHKDPRRARAAALSMIPTSTGAAKTIGLILPELSGKLAGSAIRVPTPNVSMVDLVVYTKKVCNVETINQAIIKAAHGNLKGILSVAEHQLVSIDFNHNSASSIFDPFETSVINKHLARIISWYDNEWGFSCRMLDLATYLKDSNSL
jgi:glyceraldehyde 3-phosphate dehydrogenase